MNAGPSVGQAEDTAYGGSEELDALEHAHRYNRHIARCFVAACPAPLNPASEVLDFGAGIGTITKLFAELSSVRPRAVELDAQQRQRLQQLGFEARASILDYPAASFTLVYSSNVLEHIGDDVAALRDVYSRLLPGGRAAFWVPAFPVLWTGLDERVGHVRRYTRASLRRAFELSGFVVERVQHQDSLGFFATLGVKWLRRNVALSASSVRLYDRALFPVSRLIDRWAWPLVGKNLLIVARRP